MWLLNARTYNLESFEGDKIPPYAILSHRWEDDEALFADVENGRHKAKAGWEKICRCCEQAVKEGHNYVWADTCCIDKRSSAELSEAINSMFRWYRQAVVCYAYLSDVSSGKKVLTESVWFTRGWTLQELLAPKDLFFFDNAWRLLGSKREWTDKISLRTGIPKSVLHEFDPMGGVSPANNGCIAQKMSWAAGRKTTRVEDRAYSLLGIFDVNMPLLYGEGEKAFARLQEELSKVSDDLTLFTGSPDLRMSGLLANSPDAFAACGKFWPLMTEYTMTKHCLTVSVCLVHYMLDVYFAQLGYRIPSDEIEQWTDVGIFVRQFTLLDPRRPRLTRVILDNDQLGSISGRLFKDANRRKSQVDIEIIKSSCAEITTGKLWSDYVHDMLNPPNTSLGVFVVVPGELGHLLDHQTQQSWDIGRLSNLPDQPQLPKVPFLCSDPGVPCESCVCVGVQEQETSAWTPQGVIHFALHLSTALPVVLISPLGDVRDSSNIESGFSLPRKLTVDFSRPLSRHRPPLQIRRPGERDADTTYVFELPGFACFHFVPSKNGEGEKGWRIYIVTTACGIWDFCPKAFTETFPNAWSWVPLGFE